MRGAQFLAVNVEGQPAGEGAELPRPAPMPQLPPLPEMPANRPVDIELISEQIKVIFEQNKVLYECFNIVTKTQQQAEAAAHSRTSHVLSAGATTAGIAAQNMLHFTNRMDARQGQARPAGAADAEFAQAAANLPPPAFTPTTARTAKQDKVRAHTERLCEENAKRARTAEAGGAGDVENGGCVAGRGRTPADVAAGIAEAEVAAVAQGGTSQGFRLQAQAVADAATATLKAAAAKAADDAASGAAAAAGGSGSRSDAADADAAAGMEATAAKVADGGGTAAAAAGGSNRSSDAQPMEVDVEETAVGNGEGERTAARAAAPTPLAVFCMDPPAEVRVHFPMQRHWLIPMYQLEGQEKTILDQKSTWPSDSFGKIIGIVIVMQTFNWGAVRVPYLNKGPRERFGKVC